MNIFKFIKGLFKKKEQVDRNYHHYTFTEHCRTRMKERKIRYKDVKEAMKHGRYVQEEDQIILDIDNIPVQEYCSMDKKKLKSFLGKFPIIVVIKPAAKIITTVFKGNNVVRTVEAVELTNELLKRIKK